MSVKCSNCGANITDDSKFCKYCGAKIEDNVQKVEVSGTVNQNVTHRFTFRNEASIEKARIRAEKENERLDKLAKIEEERRKAQAESDRRFKQTLKWLWIGIAVAFLVIIIAGLMKGS